MPRSAHHKKHIPLHTKELVPHGGILLEYIEDVNGLPADEKLQAHRDDHYIFILQEKGTCSIMVDFTPVETKDHCLFFIAPGQVHHYKSVTNVAGWFLAVDAALVGEYRTFFENRSVDSQLLPLTDHRTLVQCLQLIQAERTQKASMYQVSVVHTLVLAFIGMVASAFAAGE